MEWGGKGGERFVECLGSWFLLGEQGLMYTMVIDYFYSVSHIFKMLFHQLRNLASCFRNALVFYCIVFLTFFLQHIVCRGAKTPHFKNKPHILGKRPFLKIPEPPLLYFQGKIFKWPTIYSWVYFSSRGATMTRALSQFHSHLGNESAASP